MWGNMSDWDHMDGLGIDMEGSSKIDLKEIS